MIIDLDPVITRFISPPKELNYINCNYFVAGILESVLNALDFKAMVTAHIQSIENYPNRTVFLIKFESSVMTRESHL